jgi:hypothetical protein
MEGRKEGNLEEERQEESSTRRKGSRTIMT